MQLTVLANPWNVLPRVPCTFWIGWWTIGKADHMRDPQVVWGEGGLIQPFPGG